MYVDESGDPGIYKSPTRYFILSSIIIDEFKWRLLLNDYLQFRKYLRVSKGLKLEEEIHASDFINSPGDLVRIKRNIRLDILKKTIDWVIKHKSDLQLITITVDKQGENIDIFEHAWKTLLVNFQNTLKSEISTGIIITDNTNGEKLKKMMRKSSLKNIIEDPILKHSYNSLFIQIVDVIAYFCHQQYEPNNYVKKKGGHNFYKRLLSAMNFTDISI